MLICPMPIPPRRILRRKTVPPPRFRSFRLVAFLFSPCYRCRCLMSCSVPRYMVPPSIPARIFCLSWTFRSPFVSRSRSAKVFLSVVEVDRFFFPARLPLWTSTENFLLLPPTFLSLPLPVLVLIPSLFYDPSYLYRYDPF